MTIATVLEQQARRIAAMEKMHAEELWHLHKAWMIACVAALAAGFICGRLA